jgi:hypothetical protein
VSLKGQASELGLVQALELHRPVAMALLVPAMPPEAVPAAAVAQVEAIMAGLAAVEARDKGPEQGHTLKFPFPKKLERESNKHF